MGSPPPRLPRPRHRPPAAARALAHCRVPARSSFLRPASASCPTSHPPRASATNTSQKSASRRTASGNSTLIRIIEQSSCKWPQNHYKKNLSTPKRHSMNEFVHQVRCTQPRWTSWYRPHSFWAAHSHISFRLKRIPCLPRAVNVFAIAYRPPDAGSHAAKTVMLGSSSSRGRT